MCCLNQFGISKFITQAELERHIVHGHPSLIVKPLVIEQHASPPGLVGYTVKGLPPVLPPPKKRKARVGEDQEADGDPELLEPMHVQDDVVVQDEAHDDKRRRSDVGLPRIIVNPWTGVSIKAKMPTACARRFIRIQEDLLNQGRYVATYDHKHPEAQAEIPPEKMLSLPGRFAGASKQSKWGFGGKIAIDDATQFEHLEQLLRWAWDKHIPFFGDSRPSETVVVEGELSL